jgi:hypothetical protein
MPRVEADGVLAENVLHSHPLSARTRGVDLTDVLAELGDGWTISSVGSLTQKKRDGSATTDLTLGTATVNTGSFPDGQGGTVAVGKGIQFEQSGGTGGEDYLITIPVTFVNGADTEVEAFVCRLNVRDGDE